jgi:5-methylcytosine-specific restriction endonuclease McrA
VLGRRSALRPGKPLARGKGLSRSSSSLKTVTILKRSQVKQAARRDTGPDRKTREAVYERDEWRCVCCGQSVIGRPHSVGHRKRRSQGGGNEMSNLLTFLGYGNGLTENDHHLRIDQRLDPHDEARGLTVRSGQNPRLIPVMRFSEDGGGTYWATDDGRWVTEAPEGAEAA